MPIVPGFQYDLFVSYAHRNNQPFNWVSDFISDLKGLMEGQSRDFKIWFDPQLRTGDDYDLAIPQAVAASAAFLSILSPAYDDCPYCKREVDEFRKLQHPAFGMKVGTLSRLQAVVLEDLPDSRWPPEVRSTSPYRFYSDQAGRFFRPEVPSEKNEYIRGLFALRNSLWALLEEMRKQKQDGTAIERSYEVSASQAGATPCVYLAEVTDDLYAKRESLRSALLQLKEFQVETLSDVKVPSGTAALSVHLFGTLAGRPLPRQQLEAALAGNPVRRPLVWLARDLNIPDAETDAHRQFLESFSNQNGIELLRTGFEDLKSEIQTRMRPRSSPVVKTVRRRRGDSVVHIWYSMEKGRLAALKQYLTDKDCGISAFPYATEAQQKLQSKLDSCDGLIVPYTSDTQSWAEDVITQAFHLRRREDRPLAFAAVELPPSTGSDFNFEHPRVVAVHAGTDGKFEGIDQFLERLENEDG